MAGLGVHHRNDPIRRDPLRDDEAAVGGLLDVLADHGGQQLGRLGDLRAELAAAKRTQGAVAIPKQGVHQLLTGVWVVPVADRLARGFVVVIAGQRRPHQAGQLRRAGPQQPTDRAAQQRDRVLGGDRVL